LSKRVSLAATSITGHCGPATSSRRRFVLVKPYVAATA
jgi:hypothetical protein